MINIVTVEVVALLTECVDRNLIKVKMRNMPRRSHSLRSAWIEILINGGTRTKKKVALLTECVDRNPRDFRRG